MEDKTEKRTGDAVCSKCLVPISTDDLYVVQNGKVFCSQCASLKDEEETTKEPEV